MTTSGGDAPPSDPDPPVPKLPRGRGLRLSRFELFRIVGLTFVLVFLLVTQRPCANAVSRFVTSFDDNGSAAATLPRPGTVDVPATPTAPATGAGSEVDRYERLRPGMTEAEIKAAIERARARAGSASGDHP